MIHDDMKKLSDYHWSRLSFWQKIKTIPFQVKMLWIRNRIMRALEKNNREINK